MEKQILLGKTPAEIQEALNISRATYHRDIAALAVASTLEAARAVLAEQLEKIKETVKEAAESVSDAVEGVKKAVSSGAVRRALNKVKSCSRAVLSGLSHFFSRSIYRLNAVGVPHSRISPVPTRKPMFIRRVRRISGNKGSASADEDGEHGGRER